jgi:hypothetical protein
MGSGKKWKSERRRKWKPTKEIANNKNVYIQEINPPPTVPIAAKYLHHKKAKQNI